MVEGSPSVFCNSVLSNFVIQLVWNFPIGWQRDNQDNDYEKDIGN